jgi:phosphoglycerate dehydrogenase-like enzyme
MLGGRVVFTNSAGIHAAPMAETVLAMILYFGRGLDFAVEGQRRAEWWQEPYFEVASPIVELADATVGILGFGGIGKEVARRVAALGARVVALKRKPPSPADAALEPVSGGVSLAPRIEVLHGAAGLDRMLGESDILVVTAPETAETRGLMDRDALRRMRQGALLVNVARGRIVDEAALVDALAAGRLRGAGLDVLPREPLPPEHPLWKLPNVLLTPLVSGVTRGFWRRETDLILRNLQRHLAGAPVDEWENVVDKLAGY